jgi:RimJ/RimL family protein N-acetyltransferase
LCQDLLWAQRMTTLHIPTIRTERLILRAPCMSDVDPFTAFLQSDRAVYVGGGAHRTTYDCIRAFGHMAGLWVLRGYGSFVITLNDGSPIGSAGPWFPISWPEPEFAWSLWSDNYEGKGYVTEAMTVLRDWTFANTDLTTLVSYIDVENLASQRVARRLGGVIDANATPPDDDPVMIYRFHQRVVL